MSANGKKQKFEISETAPATAAATTAAAGLPREEQPVVVRTAHAQTCGVPEHSSAERTGGALQWLEYLAAPPGGLAAR